MNIKLSVVVPCYNEETRFQNGFNHYYNWLKEQKFEWELILVNDGSKDKTLKLMQDSARGKRQIKILSHHPNRGKGYAIVQGVKNAKGQYILFCDLDHSVPIETVESFFLYFKKGYHAVIGSRRVRGAKLIVRQPPIREFLGGGFTLLVRILIDLNVKDATCGFKAFEKSLAKKLFGKITIYGWAFDAEIIYLCKKFKKNYAQAPVAWSDVRGSQVRLKKDILESLTGLVKIRMNDLTGIYN